MAGFNDNFAIMGEWLECSPNHKKRSKAELDREVSLEEDVKDKDFLQTNSQERSSYSRGDLSERIAARTGFNVQSINTDESNLWSLCLNLSSHGVSSETLLESPVFLSNPLLSPTTGKLSSLSLDHKAKDEFFDSTINGLEPDDSQAYEQTHDSGLGDSVLSVAPGDDGYNWRKYGQKLVKGSEYPRSYYKCTHPNCEVKKKVERSREGYVTEIIYAKTHNHPKPSPNRRSGIGTSGTCNDMQIDGTEQQEGFAGANENIEWTSPVSHPQFGYGDEGTDAFFKNEEDRTCHMNVSIGYKGEADESEPKRRKLEACASRTNREPKVVVQTTSEVDILEDGYRWRKYGQKVVKGNPNPRSYYKCTASGCIVTKHVERASDDLTSVLTTYIGKHTHEVPAARNSSHLSSSSSGATTTQGSLATQTTQNHPVPHSRYEGMVTANSSLFDFQTPMRPPWAGFSAYGGETELLGLSISGLDIGQERLSMPTPASGDTAGLMLQLPSEPKVEPVSPQELGFSRSSLIYRDMSTLPQI
ncbi:unnamed protein product [Eruca vesicaria subsp. sativa]|uniref:WRKY domain-containing protein n=1 Tax=Eruca vesicaria subsp. sativa TaxID=29727 RepID=A0ABC8J8U1_ERUVS|nr:unnamed protein product [Eruca vesicaria subsp. sativa]